MAARPEDVVETASDPEEDDLDDLDDVLDAFDPKPQLPSEPKPTASGPGRPPKSPPPITTADPLSQQDGALPQAPPPTAISTEESLEAQLQAGMASLVSSLGENPEMQAQFEAMMQELIAAGNAGTDEEAKERVERATDIALPKGATAAVPPDGAAPATTSAGAIKKKDDFQSTIRKTMERMQNSDTSAASASAKAGATKSEEEMLMEMLQSLGGAEGLGGVEGGQEDFNSMLLNMMTQLVNKDILYEPMKELDLKFPGWMEKNGGSTKADDLARYKEQQRLVREIVGRFERNGYSDDNEADRDYIVERMQKMQEAGSPPPDLVGDMSAAQEALGELDQGCPTQ